MDAVEVVGGLLYGTDDPDHAASMIASALEAFGDRRDTSGVDPVVLRIVRRAAESASVDPAHLCSLGAAWAKGHRAAMRPGGWEAVATLPHGWELPAGVRRTTGETIVGMLREARRRVRMAFPFLDQPTALVFADPIAAATSRGVTVEIAVAGRRRTDAEALRLLKSGTAARGDGRRLLTVSTAWSVPWPHLKVVVADSEQAYVGSANLTKGGLSGNIELGVLVSGPGVAAVEAVLDLLHDSPWSR
jgi:phosphatidylserine/phosphatidylglycerophosphate/cardiolipin synthase-like enzyme